MIIFVRNAIVAIQRKHIDTETRRESP